MTYLIVFLGGGLGAAARHGVNTIAARLLGTSYPFGTFAVNITGSLAMGLLAGYLAHRAGAIPQHWRLLLATGFLGGYTTFSAFSLETALLYQRGELLAATAYALGSIMLGVAGFFLGLWTVRI
jgi:CrcB protein